VKGSVHGNRRPVAIFSSVRATRCPLYSIRSSLRHLFLLPMLFPSLHPSIFQAFNLLILSSFSFPFSFPCSFHPFILASFHPFILASIHPFILSSFHPSILSFFHPSILPSFYRPSYTTVLTFFDAVYLKICSSSKIGLSYVERAYYSKKNRVIIGKVRRTRLPQNKPNRLYQ